MLKIAGQAVVLMRLVTMSRRIVQGCALDPKEQGDDQRLENER